MFFGVGGSWSSRRCANRDCGLVWLDPMPLEADLPLMYENYFTHEDEAFWRYVMGDLPGTRRLARFLNRVIGDAYKAREYGYGDPGSLPTRLLAPLAHLHPGWRAGYRADVMYLHANPGGRLLEIGFGAGAKLRAMKSYGWRVKGVDRDPLAVKRARDAGLDADLGTLEEQRYPSGSFDAVVTNHVIEHVPDPVGLMREVRRVLRPGGRFVVLTPNSESWGTRIFAHADVMYMDTPRHLYLFSMSSLRRTAEAAGFTSLQVATTVRHAALLYLTNRAIERTGSYEIGRPALGDRLRAKAVQFAEWLVHQQRKNAGEEVVMVAVK